MSLIYKMKHAIKVCALYIYINPQCKNFSLTKVDKKVLKNFKLSNKLNSQYKVKGRMNLKVHTKICKWEINALRRKFWMTGRMFFQLNIVVLLSINVLKYFNLYVFSLRTLKVTESPWLVKQIVH